MPTHSRRSSYSASLAEADRFLAWRNLQWQFRTMLRAASFASWLAALASLIGTSCGPGATAPTPRTGSQPAPAPAPAAGAVAVAPTATEPVAETPPPPTPGRPRFHLAAFPERAELRHGTSLFADLGGPAGTKYVLGGFGSRGGPATFEEVEAEVSRGARLAILLPADGPEAQRLTVRARTFGPGPVSVYVGGETVGTLAFPDDGSFGVATMELPAGTLSAGENDLVLRARRTGRHPGLERPGVAVDWLRRGPLGDSGEAAPALFGQVSGLPALTLEDGWTVGQSFECPEEARLRGVLRGGADARLEVVAHRDGAESVVIGTLPAGAAQVFDLDLGALGGRVTRLDMTARGDVEVVGPTVVTLDPREARSAPAIRNVVVFLIDTLRADRLTPYNPETRVRTPALSRFVEAATTMGGAHSQENWTKPSVATLLSSLMPWQHTAIESESVVPRSVELLPERLQAHGFHTGSFIANGYVSDRFGFGQGWNTYRNYIREGRRTRSEFVAADVLAWLDARPEESPFFLYVHTIDPHVPYRPPARFLELYGEPGYRGRVDFRRDATFLENVKLGRIRLADADRRHLEALYDGEISYHDVHFGAILEGLERRGLADDTLVIVTSDHGEEFWDHGSVGHGHSVYEELIRVPMFVRIPGVTDGLRRVDAPVGLVDVVPTVLEALGKPLPDDLSGHSFLALLRGEDSGAPRFTVSGFMNNWRTAVTGRTKLIQRANGSFRLFDLVDDPGEEQDVASERPIAARLARGLLGLRLAETRARRRRGSRRSRPTHRSEATEIDPELAAQLRALGYVP